MIGRPRTVGAGVTPLLLLCLALASGAQELSSEAQSLQAGVRFEGTSGLEGLASPEPVDAKEAVSGLPAGLAKPVGSIARALEARQRGSVAERPPSAVGGPVSGGRALMAKGSRSNKDSSAPDARAWLIIGGIVAAMIIVPRLVKRD